MWTRGLVSSQCSPWVGQTDFVVLVSSRYLAAMKLRRLIEDLVYPASSALRRKMNGRQEIHVKSMDELPYVDILNTHRTYMANFTQRSNAETDSAGSMSNHIGCLPGLSQSIPYLLCSSRYVFHVRYCGFELIVSFSEDISNLLGMPQPKNLQVHSCECTLRYY